MDTDRFDNLVRSLFAGVSRRRLLAGLFATLPAAAGTEGEAKKRKKGRKKKKKNGACPPERICGAACCAAGTVCAGGVCRGSGTCQPTDNLCAAVANCNGNGVCGCLRHFSDGAVLCGTSNPDGCAIDCQDDADCAGFGEDAFCVKKVGEICCFGLIPLNQGFCALPCPT